MNKELYQKIKLEIAEFREKALSYERKEISLKDFKGYSGGFGSYGERGGNSFMVRLRMNQGRVTKEKLNFVVEMAKKYQIKKIHFTTCETIQLHNLTADAVADIMLEALDKDIVCRGGGGDFPRNVMCTPLSGVNKEETFDVLPYASAVSDYLLTLIHTVKLPRKLKVAFENTSTNSVHATFRDLGFVAKANGNFDVYCAGGLGQNPKMGVLVATDAKPNQVLYYVQAMVDTFVENGNYTNRAKARTRYMQETLGVEGLKTIYNQHLTRLLNTEGLTINPLSFSFTKEGSTTDLKDWRLIAQNKEGLYAVMFHPLGGDIKLEELEALAGVISKFAEVELRIGPDQSVYVINLSGTEAEEVLKVTNFGAKNIFETSVSCVGSTICQVGLRDSNGLLNSLIAEFRREDSLSDFLPRIHVSGCPSSCGTQQIGELGFQGSFKLIDKRPEPAFILSVCGNDLATKEKFGTPVGTILQTNIYAFLKELALLLKQNSKAFTNFYLEDKEKFDLLLQKYL